MILDQTLAGKIAKFTGLGICLVITVFPLYWILVTSFKDPGSIFAYPLKYWPTNFSLENYTGLFEQSNFGVFIGNSLIVSLVAAALATLVSLLAAYVLARFEFVSKGAVMGAFLVTQMIPGFIALGSLYILMTALVPGRQPGRPDPRVRRGLDPALHGDAARLLRERPRSRWRRPRWSTAARACPPSSGCSSR